ncbi:MAG TPA: ion transporter [Pyrinomonadaceae bacterium]|jgi:voltage-gated potassium channel
MAKAEKRKINRERTEILESLDRWLETPLLILGFGWLALLIVEFVRGTTPFLSVFSDLIWIIFIADFVLKFTLAPKKIEYLKTNWITAIALAAPALRILRIFRVMRIVQAARFTRGLRLVRVLTSLNHGMKALAASFGRRGFPYVVAATLIVLFAGAAGMFAFENEVPNTGIDSYGSAVWFTSMIITSIGSDYFPKTAEGRVLCFLIGLYGFIVFGYLTATLATFFVEREANNKDSAIADAGQIENLQMEISALRDEIRLLSEKIKN